MWDCKEFWVGGFPIFSLFSYDHGICIQSGSSTKFHRENTPDLECIAAALDAEMTLYRLPQGNIQAAVISQDDRKLVVYLINTRRMSISAEPGSLKLHSDR